VRAFNRGERPKGSRDLKGVGATNKVGLGIAAFVEGARVERNALASAGGMRGMVGASL